MILAPLLGPLALLLLVAVVAVPLLSWAERKQAAWFEDRSGPERAALAGASFSGLLQPAAEWLRLLSKHDRAACARDALLHRLAPLLACVPILTAFALVPLGGRYRFGAITLQPVVADIDWGVLGVLLLSSLSALAPVVAAHASGGALARLGGLSVLMRCLSAEMARALSLMPMLVLFGSLRLSEIGQAQDATLPAFGFLHLFGVGELPPWLAMLRLPAWGAFLNPVACLSFLVCGMAAAGLRPFDLAHTAPELADGALAGLGGLRRGLFEFARRAETLLLASLWVIVFLGGWTLPWLSQSRLVAAIVPFYGEGVAVGLCLIAHLLAFAIKLVFAVGLFGFIGAAIPRYRADRLMRLCWRIVVPLAFANIFATALAVRAAGGIP